MYSPPKRKKLSKEERMIVYNKCGAHCAYCGIEIALSQMQVDHVIPVELNGKDEQENYLPACRSCNNYKSSLTLEKFRMSVMKWHDVLTRGNVTYRNAVRFGIVMPNAHYVQFYFEKIGVEAPKYICDDYYGEINKTMYAEKQESEC